MKMAIISESWKLDFIALAVGVATVFYLYARRSYSYWERNGFKSVPGVNLLFGNYSKAFTQKEHFVENTNRLYEISNEPFVGIYTILRPVLLVRDPELIRSILIKDFAHFTDRGIHCNEEYDPLSANLVALPSSKWRNMRSKLTPAFTSGKLKAMFSTLSKCGATLQEYLEKISKKGELLDVREISASYSTNIIASTAFGLEVDAINDPNNEFRVCGRKIFEVNMLKAIRDLFHFIAPNVMTILRIKSNSNDIEHFIRTIVKDNLEYREKNNIVRKDFFQLLIQLRNNGTVQLDDEWETVIKADENQKTMTLNEMCAQSFVFFAAGFETSSTTLSFCMYEVAKNPEIQQKIHDEIDRVLEKNGGEITYESISEMKYLESCLDETLRKYSVAPMLNRTCVRDYTIPGTDKIIKKGIEVFIPIHSLHRSSKYYDDPNTFNPDRFSEEGLNGVNQVNRPYYPFGDGPRNCIGMRLGKMQTKMGLVAMLQKNRFELDERLKEQELQIDPRSFLLTPLGGLKLYVHKR